MMSRQVRDLVQRIIDKRADVEVQESSPSWWSKRVGRGHINEPMFNHSRGRQKIDSGSIDDWRRKHSEFVKVAVISRRGGKELSRYVEATQI